MKKPNVIKSRWQELTLDGAIAILKKEHYVCGQFSDRGDNWHFDEMDLVSPGSSHPFVKRTPHAGTEGFRRFRVKETWDNTHGWGRWGA